MSSIEKTLEANRRYAEGFDLADLPIPPARKLVVVACMDARLTVEDILGLKTGDAHIIRNAGGVVTEDALRSLIISQHLLGTEEVLIINHTDCGMLSFRDEDLRRRLEEQTGSQAAEPRHFHAFGDLEQNVREQIKRVRSHPWIRHGTAVRGFVYDVKSGRLREVKGSDEAAA